MNCISFLFLNHKHKSYNPYDGPNDNPEVELPLTAGEYIYVYGDMDDDGFYEGESFPLCVHMMVYIFQHLKMAGIKNCNETADIMKQIMMLISVMLCCR